MSKIKKFFCYQLTYCNKLYDQTISQPGLKKELYPTPNKFHTPCKSCENTLSLPSDTMYRTPCHSGHVWQSFIPLANRVRIPLPFPQIPCIVPHVTQVMFDKVPYPLQIVWEYPFPSLRYYVSYPVSLRSCLTKFHTPCKSCENTLSLPSDTMYHTPCHWGHVWQSFIPLANRVRIPFPFPQILCIVPHVTEVMFDKVLSYNDVMWRMNHWVWRSHRWMKNP